MANLILQHWNNKMPEWARLATETIKLYAKDIGVEYRLISGWPMGEFRGAVSQKIAIVLEEYDKYDDVVMLDSDMVYSGIKSNCFDFEGIGRLHLKAMKSEQNSKQGRYWPNLYKQGSPLFFGNFIKLTREERIALRKHIPSEEFVKENMSNPNLSSYNTSMPPNDEQTLHYMIHTSGALKDKKELQVPHDRFCDLPEEAHPKATLLHFCGSSRKNNIESYVKQTHGLRVL